MADNTLYVQAPTFYLAGAGVVIGATSLTLTSFSDIYGNILTMASFGTTGYGTLEPDTANEEAFTFSGVTANANGTYTLTGVSTALAQAPYTQTSGLVRGHSGGLKVVITDNAAFWDTFGNKANDETVTGQWTFSVFPITPSNSDASTTVKGVTKLSVAPASAANPVAVGTNDSRIPVAYAVDASGTDNYVITPSPAITAYVTGQTYVFKAGTANTTNATLNVSGLGPISIRKNVSVQLDTGDILLNQVVVVVYDGSNMQMVNPRIIDAITQISGVIPVANVPQTAFTQVLSPSTNAAITEFASTSSNDGSVLYCQFLTSGNLYRFQRDSVTGQYFETHTVATTINQHAGDVPALVLIGSFVYLFGNDNTNFVCKRYAAADLTGETSMTIPTVANTGSSTGWSDGTFLYLISNSAITTCNKWSVSGTTFSAVSTPACSGSISGFPGGAFYDGTTVYVGSFSAPTLSILKLSDINGTSITSTTTKRIGLYSDSVTGGLVAPIDSTRMYIGNAFKIYNATVTIATELLLQPVTKP